MNNKITPRFWVLAGIVLLAALCRIFPHPPNFAPIASIALFGATYFQNRNIGVLLPLISVWLSDLVLNNGVYAQYYDGFVFFTPGGGWVYAGFVLTSLLGFVLLRKVTFASVTTAAIASAILFFIVTNIGVWVSGQMYPQTLSGLVACFIAAIPFFANTLLGNLFFSAVLFGSFELAARNIRFLQTV